MVGEYFVRQFFSSSPRWHVKDSLFISAIVFNHVVYGDLTAVAGDGLMVIQWQDKMQACYVLVYFLLLYYCVSVGGVLRI